MANERSRGIGNLLAPSRFVAFMAILIVTVPVAGYALGCELGFRYGPMIGFDIAAIVFIASCVSLLGREADAMRAAAIANDANRGAMLVITGAVMVAILVAVASELMDTARQPRWAPALVIATLVLAWAFSNLVYALHYAHMFYTAEADGTDRGGLDVPGTGEPDYWDFLYFAYTLGMTFQTSDVGIIRGDVRRVVLMHSIAAFVFNIGVLAFTINVLGGGASAP